MNELLKKDFEKITQVEENELVEHLIHRLKTEFKKQDKGGIYGVTQYQLAYNSNKIEGSQLTENQTVSLFETGTIFADGESFRAKDVEEATGHFMMFNYMLNCYEAPLTEEIIKKMHFRLKSGVFEDYANGYPAGEYKIRNNRVGMIQTTPPESVEEEINKLLYWYECQSQITVSVLADFHLRYERIHPFQDGNGRTGRMILYKECLKNKIMPFVIRDQNKAEYYNALQKNSVEALTRFFRKEQMEYHQTIKEYLYEYGKKRSILKSCDGNTPKIKM